jgi:hypothetical protein
MGPTALLPLRRKCVLGIFITHKNPPPSVGLELATECPVGSVASTLTMHEENYAFEIVVGTRKGKRTMGRNRWEYNIKMNHKEKIQRQGVEWIEVAQDGTQ